MQNLNIPIIYSNSTPSSFNASASLNKSQINELITSAKLILQKYNNSKSSLNTLRISAVSQALNRSPTNKYSENKIIPASQISVNVTVLNLNEPYGTLISNGNFINPSNKIYNFASTNTHTGQIYIYNVTVVKAVPKVNLKINGMQIPLTNVNGEIHIPIINGHIGFTNRIALNLNMTVSANILNNLPITYAVKDINTGKYLSLNNITSSNVTKQLDLSLPMNASYDINVNVTGNNNYTSIDPVLIPTNIIGYAPITLTYNGLAAYPSTFQQTVTANELNYANYINYNGKIANFEFFYANGTIIPSWIESNTSSILTIWNNISNSIFPNTGSATATNTIYIGFASNSDNLLNNINVGEAPQLSSTYAQYDDGSHVFIYYNVNPTSTTGWTIAGTAGQKTSVPSGSHYSTTNAFYANSANGDYLYSAINGLSSNEIISFNVYSTGLGNLFFLANSAGKGQMGRLDTRGGSDYSGLATTTSWTSWAAPSGLDESKNTWYKYDIVINSTATAYIGSISNPLAALGTKANQLSYTNNGNYIGLVGDALGSSYITYWNGMIIRAYPPNGVMPTYSIGSVVNTNGIPSLAITPYAISYGNTAAITSSGNPNTDTIELFLNGNLIAGPTTNTITYTFNSLSSGNSAGSYTFNAFDENSSKSSIGILIVNKISPSLTLPNFPINRVYNGTNTTVTANVISYKNQVLGKLYQGNSLMFSTNTQSTISGPSAIGTHAYIFNTTGNANYTSLSVSKSYIVYAPPNSIPSNILYYVPVFINNTQAVSTSSPSQQQINISEASFTNYIAYNSIFANFEYFYSNGTIIPSWINTNSTGKIVTWIKLNPSIPASSSFVIYLGFANKTSNLLSSSGTTGIGEAPQLSSTYAEYDDGANVFLNYFSGASSSGWTILGAAGQTASAPSGNNFFGINAFYADGANGDYLYTIASNQSSNTIIEFYGYTANLQDFYFLVNSAGAGQMLRDGNGGGWYGVASTSSWTSWTAPPDSGSWSNEWVTVGLIVGNGNAIGYLSPSILPYGSEIGSNPSNEYNVANNGNYIGLVGDGASGSTIQYWNGIIVRSYPPNGVMPSFNFGSVIKSTGTCTISLNPVYINFGNQNPLSSIPTNNGITDTNTGNVNAYMLVYGGNWIAGSTHFGVSNTTWSMTSNTQFSSANMLSATAANTAILVPATSSNSIYFGLDIPGGTPTGAYTETITIENSC
jgi:hypothetical protein